MDVNEALAGINATTGSPDHMVNALAKFVGDLPPNAAVLDQLAEDDMKSVIARYTEDDLVMLDKATEAKLREQKRSKWAEGARTAFDNAKKAHQAIAAQLDEVAARQQELPSVAAAHAGASDANTTLLARLVDGIESQAAERYTESRSAADVVRRYREADEAVDGPFVRYVERAMAGGVPGASR